MPTERPPYLQAYDAAKRYWQAALTAPCTSLNNVTSQSRATDPLVERYDLHPRQAVYVATIALESVLEQRAFDQSITR